MRLMMCIVLSPADWNVVLDVLDALQAGLWAKPKLGTRDAMELGAAGPRGGGRLPCTAAEVADPCWVIDKVPPI